MLTILVALGTLSDAPPYWSVHHHAIALGVGVVLDVLLVFCVAVTVVAAGWASGRPWALDALQRLAGLLARLDGVVIALACVFLTLLVAITFLSVVGRNVWVPIPDDITLAEWAMVGLVMVMLGTTQGRGEHIEVTALSEVLPLRVDRALRLLGALLGVGFIGLFTFVNYPEVADAFLEETYGSIYALPRWPPRLVFFLGIAVWLARIYAQAAVLMADAIRPLPLVAERRALDLAPLLPADAGGAKEETSERASALPRERVGDGA
ncbi:TRAP transporter small permease [Acuticoccus sp.]|uniref:TRAP transporter small permease n=1 Tax=Acuticoccus sp. TaxID=1904378 RepID=UPI003B5272B3